MKIVTFGKEIENNKKTRYALIIMKLDKPEGYSIDEIITFVYSNNLEELKEQKKQLKEISSEKPFYLDIRIYDYTKMKYVSF